MRLNPAPLANIYSLLYLHKWSDEAAVSDVAAIEIDRLHHSDAFTERHIDNACLANFWL
jgi:hypothetical protein